MNRGVAIAAFVLLTFGPSAAGLEARDGLTGVKRLRCSFPRVAVGRWKPDGAPETAVNPATLVLLFDSIDPDAGTARLRSGSVFNEIVASQAGGYLHLMQTFRTGPLYTTTVFDQSINGKFKAVHSRHESFTVPLPGSTSTPEQYYGTCEVLD
jgi:hypothetical protein